MGEQGYVNIGQIGHKFIGKAHTHAYTNVGIFFAVKLRPVKKVLCGVGEDLPKVAQPTLTW